MHRLTTLLDLFAPGHLLRDADGDGIADGIAASVEAAGDVHSLAGALEVAARLGLESAALSLPVAGAHGPVRIRIGPGLLPLEQRPGLGLIAVTDQDLVITGDAPADVLLAARYLAGRYPFLGRAEAGAPLVDARATALFVGNVGLQAVRVGGRWEPVEAPRPVHVSNRPADRAPAPLSAGLERLFEAGLEPVFRPDPGLSPAEQAGAIDLAARFGVEATRLRFPLTHLPGEQQRPGLQVALLPAGVDGPGISLSEERLLVQGAPALRWLACTPDLAAALRPWPAARPAPPERPAGLLTYQGEWEVDRFRRLWQEQVRPALEPGRPAQVDLRLSEPQAVRQELQAELLAELPPGSQVQVRSCFKQGLHWIMEEILPELRTCGPVARVEIAFRRFSGRAPAGEPVLELPIRWLQECYPADSLLARELGLAESAITFAMAEEGPTYRLTAYSADGEPLLARSLEAQTGLRRYLDAFPERGWIHPPTGSLHVNGQSYGPLPTDPEAFWDWYQAAVLPALRQLILAGHGEKPSLEAQPLFGSLRLEVQLSEENRRLGIREEMISPLDALHEDLYFVTLDYMATWGRSLHGQPFGAPGSILPFVRAGAGAAPGARVSLSRRADSPAPPAAPPVLGVRFGPGGQPAELLTAHGPEQAPASPGPLAGVSPAPDSPAQAGVIGPAQLPGYLARLRHRPGVRLWQAGLSFQGRPCWAMELRLPLDEQIIPPAKSAALKPVLLINARHHANEVSSTNAALMLAEQAASGDPELGALLRTATVVINPLENMDGAAVHYLMMQEQPTWKLHAARFNAVGLEFYGQYLEPQTIYGEARVLPALFERFRPDIMLDDHGVPSHEWLQPFAGSGSAPYFKHSYWLPNALLYGIFRQYDPQTHPHQVQAAQALRERLVRRVRAEPELFAQNQMWLERYRKWGHTWEPDRFPLEVHAGMICYTWPAGAHSWSTRFPELCVVDWVTEVPDETAQGEQLRLTAQAHGTAHMACLEFLAQHPQPVLRTAAELADGSLRRSIGRRRPFITGGGAETEGGV